MLATASLVMSAPARAEIPDAESWTAQGAWAEWVVETDDGLRMFFVHVHRGTYQQVPSQDVGLVGASITLGRGPCRTIHSGHDITCRARWLRKPICADHFWVHPLLNNAAVEFRALGRRHRVRWDGLGMGPTAEHAGYARPGAAGGMIGVFRRAEARGTVIGEKLSPNATWVHNAQMDQRVVLDATFLQSRDSGVYIRRYEVPAARRR